MTETKYSTLDECMYSINPIMERKMLENKDKFIFGYCVEDLKQSRL